MLMTTTEPIKGGFCFHFWCILTRYVTPVPSILLFCLLSSCVNLVKVLLLMY